jgi:hypothetical protein
MSIEVVPCPFHRGVDLTDDRAGADGDPIHLFPAEWVEFLSAIKDGKYDTVLPSARAADLAG